MSESLTSISEPFAEQYFFVVTEGKSIYEFDLINFKFRLFRREGGDNPWSDFQGVEITLGQPLAIEKPPGVRLKTKTKVIRTERGLPQ